MAAEAQERDRQTVTSSELSGRAVIACWGLGVTVLAAGATATFVRENGAGAAALILFGSVLIIVALMRRVPLRFEVAGAKLDATYEKDRAFEAGRESGLARGKELVADEVRASVQQGEPAESVLERVVLHLDLDEEVEDTTRLPLPLGASEVLVSGPEACRIGGVTYRQLEYWARTGLVTPSGGAGDRPRYTFADLVLLRVIKELLDTGVSLQQIRAAVAGLRGRDPQDLAELRIVSDGHEVHELRSDEEVARLLREGRALFAISVARITGLVLSIMRHPAHAAAWGEVV